MQRTATLIDGRSIVHPSVSYQDALVQRGLRPTDDCKCTILPSLGEAVTAWDCPSHGREGHPRELLRVVELQSKREAERADSPFQAIGLVDLGKL